MIKQYEYHEQCRALARQLDPSEGRHIVMDYEMVAARFLQLPLRERMTREEWEIWQDAERLLSREVCFDGRAIGARMRTAGG